MDLKLVSIIAFRGLSTLLSLQGKAPAAMALNRLIAAIEAGANVDRYMAGVAKALEAGTAREWDDITASINEEVDELLSRGEGGETEFVPEVTVDDDGRPCRRGQW